jgi:hypothetical protein
MANEMQTAGAASSSNIIVIRAVRAGYAAVALLPSDDAAHIIRGLRRSWMCGNLTFIRAWLESAAVLLECVEGAWNARESCLLASSRVLSIEVSL